MLRVHIVLHHAVTGEVKEIASMNVVNDGTGDDLHGNYVVDAEWLSWPRTKPFTARGTVKKHDRHMSVWALLGKAIKSLK